MRNTIWLTKGEELDEFMERTQLLNSGMESVWSGVSRDGAEWLQKKVPSSLVGKLEHAVCLGDEELFAAIREHGLVEGKWIGRCYCSKVEEVKRLLRVLCDTLYSRKLGPAFEMTKMDKYTSFTPDDGYLIGVYTEDLTNKAEVKRVLDNAEEALAGFNARFDKYKPTAITQLEAMNDGRRLKMFMYSREELHLAEWVEDMVDEPSEIFIPAPPDLIQHTTSLRPRRCAYTAYKVPHDVPSKQVLEYFSDLCPVFLERHTRPQHHNGTAYHNVVFECLQDCAMETFFPPDGPRYKVSLSQNARQRSSKVLRVSIPHCTTHLTRSHVAKMQQRIEANAGYPIPLHSFRLDPAWKPQRCHVLQLQFHSSAEVAKVVTEMFLDCEEGIVDGCRVHGVQADAKPKIYTGSTRF